jgi:hypothetical protein
MVLLLEGGSVLSAAKETAVLLKATMSTLSYSLERILSFPRQLTGFSQVMYSIGQRDLRHLTGLLNGCSSAGFSFKEEGCASDALLES